MIGVKEAPYPKEEVLQRQVSQFADKLIPGDQLAPSNPRRWLLISDEAGVPDSDQGSARWSVDHLFLDQDGIPTLVEVKRSSDTRIRREVVGQMFDYAALFYNPKRRHGYTNQLSPVEPERQYFMRLESV